MFYRFIAFTRALFLKFVFHSIGFSVFIKLKLEFKLIILLLLINEVRESKFHTGIETEFIAEGNSSQI